MWWLVFLPVFLVASAAQAGELPTKVMADPVWGDPVDRLVAVVDEDPIFFSDLRRAVRLGWVTGLEAGSETAWRTVLDRLVEQRLRAHEVDRYGMPPAPEAAVAGQIARLTEDLGGEARLAAELRELGSNPAELERLIGQQLRIYAYVEERLAPRVLVDDEDIAAYYEDELRAAMAQQGSPLPPLPEVQAGIRAVLRERALNAEIDRWTADLRQRARVRDLLDLDSPSPLGAPDELPPIVLQIDGGN